MNGARSIPSHSFIIVPSMMPLCARNRVESSCNVLCTIHRRNYQVKFSSPRVNPAPVANCEDECDNCILHFPLLSSLQCLFTLIFKLFALDAHIICEPVTKLFWELL